MVHDLAYNTERREEIEKAKRQGEEAGGDLRDFNIRNMSPEERDCREAERQNRDKERHTDTDRHTVTDRGQGKADCQEKG